MNVDNLLHNSTYTKLDQFASEIGEKVEIFLFCSFSFSASAHAERRTHPRGAQVNIFSVSQSYFEQQFDSHKGVFIWWQRATTTSTITTSSIKSVWRKIVLVLLSFTTTGGGLCCACTCPCCPCHNRIASVDVCVWCWRQRWPKIDFSLELIKKIVTKKSDKLNC